MEGKNFELDYTLIQIFINAVKEGNQAEIQNMIEKYNLDVKNVRDTQYDQNCIFFCCLIRDDETYLIYFNLVH